MAEVWKSVIGYEDLYLVSNQGQVKSLPRISRNGRGKTNLKGKIRKLTVSTHGYLYLPLSRNGISERFFVHQLVALVFIGPRNGLDVCHNDGCITNNYHTNLRYDTAKGNMADKLRHGTQRRGENHGANILTEKQVLLMRAMAPFMSQYALAKKFGIKQPTVSNILDGKRWGHLPLKPVKISQEGI